MGVNQDNVSYKLWAQGGAELVIIPENKQNGDLDLNYLEEQLGISFLLIDGVYSFCLCFAPNPAEKDGAI